MENLLDILVDAFKDMLRTIPFLMIAFFLIELIQHMFGETAKRKFYNIGKWGFFYGALLGSIPHFSIIAGSLFIMRIITPGTLIAVFIAASDEAIPILLATPKAFSVILPLISVKIIAGMVAGAITDFFWKRETKLSFNSNVGGVEYNPQCIGDKQTSYRQILLHTLKHTRHIAVFIFLATVILNIVFASQTASTYASFFAYNKLLQPLFVAIFGLIPNCATSVIITQAYLLKIISFGALVAGLSSNAGLGLLVVLKEVHSKKDAFKIIALLILYSTVIGILTSFPLFKAI